MMTCLRRVSMVLAAMLTTASACLAADPGGSPGQASLGGSLGLSSFRADGDYTMSRNATDTGWGERDAKSRFAFAAAFRYQMSKHFRWQLSPGFLWTGYEDHAKIPFRSTAFPNDSTKGDLLALMMPVSVQLHFVHRTKHFLFHEGGGPGIYRVWVEQHRHVLKDPTTKRLHAGYYPGASGELGVEYFLKSQPAVSIEFTTASHLAMATRDEQFPAGFDNSVWTLEARIGANYYFHPGVPRKAGAQTAAPK